MARTLGLDVVVVDVAERALARAASADAAQVIVGSHRQRGIDLQFSCGVSGLEGAQGQVTAVHRADGQPLLADIVVVGIGVEPRMQLAVEAGLVIENGVVVDEQLLSSDPNISALIGVAASFETPLLAGGSASIFTKRDRPRTCRCSAADRKPAPAPPSRGSGATRAISSCRSQACVLRKTITWCWRSRVRVHAPSCASAKSAWPRWRPSIVRPTTCWRVACWQNASASAPPTLANPASS